MLPPIMKYTPAVCAVGKNYQILIPVRMPEVLWVRVGETDYYDESNGILHSDTDLHRVTAFCGKTGLSVSSLTGRRRSLRIRFSDRFSKV